MKIKNDRQLANAQSELDRIEAEIETFRSAGEEHPKEIIRAMLGALELDAETLRKRIGTYQRIVQQPVNEELLDVLAEGPGESLIDARIAAKVTQKQLAGLIGVKETQINRYETTYYATAKLPTIVAIAKALKMHVAMVGR